MKPQFIVSVELKSGLEPNPRRYPYCIPAIRRLGRVAFSPQVTFFVGENGSGKSTLIEALAVGMGINPEGGSRNFNFSTQATHSPLHESLHIAKGVSCPQDMFFLRAESFYNVASKIDSLGVIDAYGGESLHARSHGEAFIALLNHRFRANGLYILDEPEAALSPSRQLACLRRIHDLVRLKSQFIIATHSPILMAYPGALIYHLSEKGIKRIKYEETEHYQLTRMFFERRALMLKELLENEGNGES